MTEFLAMQVPIRCIFCNASAIVPDSQSPNMTERVFRCASCWESFSADELVWFLEEKGAA